MSKQTNPARKQNIDAMDFFNSTKMLFEMKKLDTIKVIAPINIPISCKASW